MAEPLGIVEEPGLRPVGSRAWWLHLAFGAAVGFGALIVIHVVRPLQG